MRQPPFSTVLAGVSVMGAMEMALDHLIPLAAFQADNVLVGDRLLNRDCWFLLGFGRRGAKAGERVEHCSEQAREIGVWHCIVRGKSGHNFRGQREQLVMFDWFFRTVLPRISTI